MKRAFIRCLFGTSEEVLNNTDYLKQLEENMSNKQMMGKGISFMSNHKMTKMKLNISNYIGSENKVDDVCYTFGEDNHKYLKSVGINSILVNKNDYVYHQYEHKLYILTLAMKDFDEIVFIDWDVGIKKPVDNDFWNILNSKREIQANLYRYKKQQKIKHRNGKENQYTSLAGFIYMRDKSLASKIWGVRRSLPCTWSAEPALTKIIDDISGGWKGVEFYGKNFEPDTYLCKHSQFHKDINKIYMTNNIKIPDVR